MHISPKKIVIFGAGKIGRSFIGSLFSKGGYEVVFVDTNKVIIEALNFHKGYNVIIKGDREETLNVTGVRGVFDEDETQVIKEVMSAEIMAISVGIRNLPSAIPLIARGLVKRYNESKIPLDIIIAENLRNGAGYIRELLSDYLPDDFPIGNMVGLVETSIGKMVPAMPEEERETDLLQVFAESYCTLIVDKHGFLNSIPFIEGLSPKTNMKAWVDRKLFVHNLGHAAVAYFGYFHYPEQTYIFEILEHNEAVDFARQVMIQASKILQSQYPGIFTNKHLHEYIEDLISRFRNKSLCDTVFRVGCDLQRKLGANDRIMAPFKSGLKHSLPVDKIVETMYFGTFFRGADKHGKLLADDTEFHKTTEEAGVEEVLARLGNLNHRERNYLKTYKKTFIKDKS